MDNIPNRFYRVSIKALILNQTRDKFLLCKESDGRFELPGGGLDWGEDPHDCLRRELVEEMGLRATHIAAHPAYFLTGNSTNYPGVRIANIIYETELEHLDFTPSDECLEIRFVDTTDIKTLPTYDGPSKLAFLFNPHNHPVK